jgi:MFS transporter, AAHS family, 4-hydroxybenzoate transporter
MFASREINISEVIDAAPIGWFQTWSIILCGLVAVLEGFDTQAIAFVAPLIAQAWSLSPGALGPIFGAGLLGLMIGALAFGPIADRAGRRWVILLSTALFGMFSLLTILAHGSTSLFTYRLLTGIGLGGAMPNIIALTAEYSPRRLRATLVTIMFCGFPLGAVIGGLVCARLLSSFGWSSVFVLGGMLPLLLLPVLFLYLPESIQFLVARRSDGERVVSILRRIDASTAADDTAHFHVEEADLAGVPLRYLFADGRTLGTLLLWVIFFSNLLVLYFLINWLPTVLRRAGLPLEHAIVGTVLLNVGGIVGGIVLGRIVDKRGPFLVLALAYGAAAVVIAAIGVIAEPVTFIMSAITAAGFFVTGSQFCMNALAAGFYPTAVRSTGIGWALGIGRIGAIIGPVFGGFILSLGWSTREVFIECAVPAIIAAIAVAAMGALNIAPGSTFKNAF